MTWCLINYLSILITLLLPLFQDMKVSVRSYAMGNFLGPRKEKLGGGDVTVC
jgi:hypothetical protein